MSAPFTVRPLVAPSEAGCVGGERERCLEATVWSLRPPYSRLARALILKGVRTAR